MKTVGGGGRGASAGPPLKTDRRTGRRMELACMVVFVEVGARRRDIHRPRPHGIPM